MEHPTHNPENDEPRFDLEHEVHAEIARAGGVAAFIRAQVAERTRSYDDGETDVHRSTLHVMERVARAALLPHVMSESTGDKARANAFYWGEILGMEVGDMVFESEGWANSLYEQLTGFHRKGMQDAYKEHVRPTFHLPNEVRNVSPDGQRALLAASLMVGMLEDPLEEIYVYEPLQNVVERYAAELAPNDEILQHHIKLGFTLVAKVFGDHTVLVVDGNEETVNLNELEEELHDIADWDSLAKYDKES